MDAVGTRPQQPRHNGACHKSGPHPQNRPHPQGVKVIALRLVFALQTHLKRKLKRLKKIRFAKPGRNLNITGARVQNFLSDSADAGSPVAPTKRGKFSVSARQRCSRELSFQKKNKKTGPAQTTYYTRARTQSWLWNKHAHERDHATANWWPGTNEVGHNVSPSGRSPQKNLNFRVRCLEHGQQLEFNLIIHFNTLL